MIRALQLVLDGPKTWDQIVSEERAPLWVFGFYYLPLAALSLTPEFLFLTRLGRVDALSGNRLLTPVEEALKYEGGRFLASLLVLFVGAYLVRLCCDGLDCGSDFRACFRFVAYGLGPMLLLSSIDTMCGLNPKIGLGLEELITLSVLYGGVPRALQPRLSQAFGLFLTVSIVVLGLIFAIHLQTLFAGQPNATFSGIWKYNLGAGFHP